MSPTPPPPEPYADDDPPSGAAGPGAKAGSAGERASGRRATDGVGAGVSGAGNGYVGDTGAFPLPDPSADLTAEALIHRHRPAPRGGWRRALFTATGGRLNPGDSKTEQRRQELEAEIRRAAIPSYHYSVAVIGAQEGVGATTVTLGLGALLAAQRADPVIAVDADPERHPLSDRLPLQAPAERGLRDLLVDPETVHRYSEMSRFIGQDSSHLDVLPSRPEDLDSPVLDPDSYRWIAEAVERFYSLILIDGGSRLDRPATPAILDRSHQLVLVAHPSREGASRAATVLDDVTDLGYDHLARSALVVLAKAPSAGSAKVESLRYQLAQRCRDALTLPGDSRLGRDTVVDVRQLRAPALFGYLELAAAVTAGFDGDA